MKFKLELLSLTAASVLAMGTAMAAGDQASAEDIRTPAEPQDQTPISIGPGLNPPAQAETRELPPEPVTPDDPADTAAAEDEQQVGSADQGVFEEDDSVEPQASAEDIRTPAEPQDQTPASIGPGLNPPAQAQTRELPPEEATPDQAAGQLGTQGEEGMQLGQAGAQDQASQGQGQAQAGAGISDTQYDRQTVMEVQQALNDQGYHSGNVDGLMGPETREAVVNFQEEQGLDASGELNEETLSALDVEAPQG